MKCVDIGKSMCRIIVRSKSKLKRLANVPEVQVDGNRVIFPTRLKGNIELIVQPPARKKHDTPSQMDLF